MLVVSSVESVSAGLLVSLGEPEVEVSSSLLVLVGEAEVEVTSPLGVVVSLGALVSSLPCPCELVEVASGAVVVPPEALVVPS